MSFKNDGEKQLLQPKDVLRPQDVLWFCELKMVEQKTEMVWKGAL